MKNKFPPLILIVFCFTIILQLASCSPEVVKQDASSAGIIDADNPNIQYIGRFDFRNPRKVVFDWPGVFISAKFDGTSCSIRLEDSTDEYSVIIDNHAPEVLTFRNSKVLKAASGLSDSISHTIIIRKKTEAFVGKGIFEGFILDKGAILLSPEKRPDRRIEFIGNSITCGYGVLGDSTNCHFTPQTEDAGMSYATILSRRLGADYHLIAYSGKGMVRNYGDKNKTSRDPMPSLYDRTCWNDTTLKWDPAAAGWVPQMVVINLGTNDFSTKPFPDKDVFEEAYNSLINRVRLLYPHVTIFCVSGPMIGEPCTDYVREVVKEQQQKEKQYKDVSFIEIPRSNLSDKDWGCDWHPNVFGSYKMVETMLPEVRLRMGW